MPVVCGAGVVSEILIVVSTKANDAVTSISGSADQFAHDAAAVLASDGVDALAQFDPYPAPLYAIGTDGHLLYYNDACVGIAGRTPQIGVDRWCLCHAILTPQGEPVAHATGSMATVLRDARPIRGIETLIEQPDGRRIPVQPYPTPALDEEGHLVGAINLIVPLDGQLYRDLLATAQRCRTLAKWIGDRQANDALTRMADECAEQALILTPLEPQTSRN